MKKRNEEEEEEEEEKWRGSEGIKNNDHVFSKHKE
jgi:hypothetical protein